MDNQTLDPQIFASPGRFLKALIITVFVSLFIGFFLHTFILNGSLYDHLVLSLAMGLSICTCINLALFVVRPRRYGYAIEAFEKQAVDYLLKPITAERLAQTVARLKKRPSQKQYPAHNRSGSVTSQP